MAGPEDSSAAAVVKLFVVEAEWKTLSAPELNSSRPIWTSIARMPPNTPQTAAPT
jgi:hypothetical protein